MKVLFVASGLGYGGAETQLIAAIDELLRLGHEPALYLLTDRVPRLSQLPAQGVVHVIDCKRRRFDLGVLRRLRRFVRSWKPDVVHGFLFDGNLYSRVAAFGTGVAVLNSERGDGYELNRAQWLAHWPTRHWAAAVVANTHAGRRFAMRLFGFPEARTHVVWNGLDVAGVDRRVRAAATDYRRQFFGSSDVYMAVLVGRITSEKDMELALDVAGCLFARDDRWRVVFIGASANRPNFSPSVGAQFGAYAQRVRQRHAAMTHPERVVFAGLRDDVLPIIADADVLYSTSRREGFPNVVLEAMCCGTPVVSTAYSDIRMILPNEWQVVPSRAPAELADAIERARRESADVAPQQRQWVLENATNAHSIAAMVRVYEQYAKI